MMPANSESDGDPARDYSHTATGYTNRSQLEALRRVVLETLDADHQALEVDANLTFRAVGRA